MEACVEVRAPFEAIEVNQKTGDWLAALDDFRNYLISAA